MSRTLRPVVTLRAQGSQRLPCLPDREGSKRCREQSSKNTSEDLQRRKGMRKILFFELPASRTQTEKGSEVDPIKIILSSVST